MQKPRNTIFLMSLGAIVIAGASLFASAQSAQAQLGATQEPLQYSVSPETPQPGQQVTILAEGVGGFLGNATITWTKDGKVALTGVGKSSYSFNVGALGTQTRVSVRIVSPTQGTFTHDFTFLPSFVTLIWEADTTTPPFFRGKSLYSAGSTVKVVAFPTIMYKGARIASNQLTLQWTLQDVPVPEQSGLGRTTLTFPGDQLQAQEEVVVDVYYGANKVARGELLIPTYAPMVLLYAKDPLRGVLYDRAIPTAIALNGKELTLQATPYFFANSSLKNKSLLYSWTLNDDDAVGPDSAKGILTLRQTGVGQGAALLDVTIQNTESDKFVQTANAAMQLIFGQSSGSSLFGL